MRRRPKKKRLPSRSTAVSGPRVGVILAALLLTALAVRLLASQGDLWLDEVLSVELARSMEHPSDVVFATQARIDNNHLLNTGWLSLVGGHARPFVQRLLSIMGGTAAVAFAYWFARRWGQSTALFAAALFAGSFVMINYASEARGYALLVCFALLAMATIDRAMERWSVGTMVLFWIACIGGTLAHLLFLQVFLAIGAWTIWRLLIVTDNRPAFLPFVARYHVVPFVFMIGLYVAFIRHIQVFGANRSVFFDVVAQTAAFVLGLPRDPLWSRTALAIAAAIVIIGIRLLWRRKDDSWVLMAMLCAGAPAVMTILTTPEFVLPRYFMVPATGVLLLAALLLGRMFDRTRRGRVMSVLVVIIILFANSRDTARLLFDGRGQYSRAVQDIAANTDGDLLRIGGDHEFRQRTMLQYYRSALPAGKKLEYVPTDRLRDVVPDWVVMHSFDPEQVPATPAIVDAAGREYRLFRIYPAGPLSGWYSYVYQR